MTTPPTNEENTEALQRRANKKLLEGIARDWTAAESAATETGKHLIVAVNRLRACGEKLKMLAGHEQITAEWYESVRKDLPKTMRYTSARAAVHISNKVEADVKTVQDAMLIQKDLFGAMNAWREPKRVADQSSHENNPWDTLVNDAASLLSLFDGMEKAEPMDQWGKVKLQTVIETTRPFVEKHDAAEELLKAL